MERWYYNYNGVLVHHGIKGQRWGVRRYQNPDGTLTAAGRKRRGIMDKAADKAKQFSDIARKDSEQYSKQADQSNSNNKLSEKQYEQAMRELFGDDRKNKEYIEEEAQSLGYDDTRQMAKAYLGIGKDASEGYKAIAERAQKAADFYESLSESYKNADITTLDRKQIKKAMQFIDKAYIDNWHYDDYSLTDTKKRYGLDFKSKEKAQSETRLQLSNNNFVNQDEIERQRKNLRNRMGDL